jgi:MSHA biogenesis protein MshQ
VRWPAALLVLLAPACSFDVDYGDTAFRCDDSDGCPAGYHCDGELCVSDGVTPGDGGYVKQLVVRAGRVDEDLADYPLLVLLSGDVDLRDRARDDGDDIAFLDDSGVVLSFEIESWDAEAGDLVAWVRVPLLGADQDTSLQLIYGGEPVAKVAAAEVWTGYRGVWHLGRRVVADATAPDEPGAIVEAVSSEDQHIGGAYRFDGGYVVLGDPATERFDFTAQESFAVSAWGRRDSETGTWQVLVSKGGSNENAPGYDIETSSDEVSIYGCIVGDMGMECSDHAALPAPGTWMSVALVVDRTTDRLLLYMNGALTAQEPLLDSIDPSVGESFPLHIGANFDGYSEWDGAVDEVRLAGFAPRPAWMLADFDSQSDPAAFVDVGDEAPR